MTIVGFNFTKVSAQRKGPVSGRVDVNNNVAIVDVTEHEMALGTAKQKGLRFTFEFSSSYKPDIGSMQFGGELLYLGDAAVQKELLAEWKKSKKVKDEVMNELLSMVLSRCNVEGLILSRDINLPPPVPLPSVRRQ